MYATTLRARDAVAIEAPADRRPEPARAHAIGAHGYLGDRRPNPIAILLLVAIHIGLFATFMSLGGRGHHQRRQRLQIVDVVPVEIAPPPPPPRAAPASRKIQTPIVAPPPIVRTSVAVPPPIAAAPAPSPPAPVAVSTAPAVAAAPAAAAASGPVAIGRLAPMPGNPPLKYPVSARMKHEEGVVRLRIVVGTGGGIEDISIAESSGFDSLDKAAMEVVRRWRFYPPTRDGVAVQGVGIFPASFKLA